ncbi:MAG: hypothetical protein Q7V57_09040 [Actinomycetota bacterium]|nr:hypothetical protein [Actinomycetota bacterium]
MKATRSLIGLAAVLALFGAACGDDDKDSSGTTAVETTVPGDETTVPETTPETTPANPYEGELVGTFAVDAGDCTGAAPAGSYFQMVMPGGTAEAGPFIANADSACTDTNYSLLEAGTDGGLVIGGDQAAPDPAFDATGNGLADKIIAPVTFFGVAFAAATDPAEAAPMVMAADGVLSGDLSAFTAYYGTGVFNQGAPKPDGSGDGPTGTIDLETGHFTLTWTSLIVGGSFDGFTGVWHLEGTFTPQA